MRIGLLGGTFNPIHNGHYQMAKKALKNHNLDVVFVVPTKNPPHKYKSELLDADHRFNLCTLAFKDETNIIVDDVELNRSGTTFTIDTLKYYLNTYEGAKLFFIIGGDTIFKLNTWKEHVEVFKLTDFIAFNRIGLKKDEVEKKVLELNKEFNSRIHFDESIIPCISSTKIREDIKNKKDVSSLINKAGEKYINEYKLYR